MLARIFKTEVSSLCGLISAASMIGVSAALRVMRWCSRPCIKVVCANIERRRQDSPEPADGMAPIACPFELDLL